MIPRWLHTLLPAPAPLPPVAPVAWSIPGSTSTAAKTPPPLLTVTQAATLAGLSRDRAYRMAQNGTLPGLVRLPGHRLIVRRATFEAALRGDIPWPGEVAP